MAAGKWTIRSARSEDLSQILRLEEENSSLLWSENSIKKDILQHPAGYSLVAVAENDIIIGFAACWFILDEAQIMIVTVDNRWRRQGIGRSLLQCLEEEAISRGVVQIQLEVRTENQAALSLYSSVGFQKIGVRPKYYADTGEGAIIMLKIISENGQ